MTTDVRDPRYMQILQAWRTSAQDLVARWKRPRTWNKHAAPTRPGRHLDASIVLLICVSVLVVAVYTDESIALAMRQTPDFIRTLFSQITKLGTSGWIFLLSALVAGGALAFTGQFRKRIDVGLKVLAARATFIFVLNAGSGLFSQFLKHVFGRARPKLLDIVGPFHFDAFSVNAASTSFPSGHAITAFATCVALACFVPAWRKAFFGIAVLVGLSRIIIGAHFPSDVLAGAAIGWGSYVVLARQCARRRIVFAAKGETSFRLRGTGLMEPAVLAVWDRLRGLPPA